MTKQLSLALRDGGTVYVYGALSNEPVQVDNLDTLYKFKRVEVSTYPLAQHWCVAVCIQNSYQGKCSEERMHANIIWLSEHSKQNVSCVR